MWDRRKLVNLTVAAGLLLLVYSYLRSPLVVTVTGQGEVEVPASRATVTFTMSVSDASPVVAVTNLKEKAASMRQLMVQNGVADSDIVESQPRVVPAALVIPQATGYQASMSMGGMTTNVNQVGQFTAALYERGATLVSQPVLSVEDEQEWAEKALNEALKDAKAKAFQIQKKQLKLIKQVGGISQSETAASGTVTSKTAVGQETGQPAPGVGVAGDSLTISKTVSVTYRMW